MSVLKGNFFDRSAVLVAKDLIGCFLCASKERYMIVETEAYEGLEDKASHASRGETNRNKIMFGDPGVWYVYLTYGLHYMLNIVCGRKGHPGAVLIRGITHPSLRVALPYIPTSPKLRWASKGGKKQNLLGPAKLTKYLKIDKSFNGKKAAKSTGLWIESPTFISDDRLKLMYGNKIKTLRTPRIGVDYAGVVWSKKKYRFVLHGFETKKFGN